MYQAVVFFDLDGTLLQDDKTLSSTVIQAITQLRQNHVLPVIATGRNLFEIQYVLQQTGIDSAVSANGSYVQLNGHLLHAEQISPELIARVNHFATHFGDPVAWFNNQSFGLSRCTTATIKNFNLLHLHPHVDPEWYQNHPVNFLFVFNRNRDVQYQQHFAHELSFVRNNPRGLDTMLAGVSKKTGIIQLLQSAHLDHLPTYGFGDQLNDLEMLELVDHPVVMANGHSLAKQKAEFVTRSNMDHGIECGLRHYHLI